MARQAQEEGPFRLLDRPISLICFDFCTLNVNFHSAVFPEYRPRFSVTFTLSDLVMSLVTEDTFTVALAEPLSGILSCSSAYAFNFRLSDDLSFKVTLEPSSISLPFTDAVVYHSLPT